MLINIKLFLLIPCKTFSNSLNIQRITEKKVVFYGVFSDAGQKAARTGSFGFKNFRFAEYLKNVKIAKPK